MLKHQGKAPGKAPAEPPPKKSVVGMAKTAIQYWREQRPDYSPQGFDAAVDEALELVSHYDYTSIEEVVDEIAEYVGSTLRSSGVTCTHIANDRRNGAARLRIRTAWGLTARIDLGIKFASKHGVLRS